MSTYFNCFNELDQEFKDLIDNESEELGYELQMEIDTLIQEMGERIRSNILVAAADTYGDRIANMLDKDGSLDELIEDQLRNYVSI